MPQLLFILECINHAILHMPKHILSALFIFFVIGFFLAWKVFVGFRIAPPDLYWLLINAFEWLESFLVYPVERLLQALQELGLIFHLDPAWKHAFSLMTLKLVGDGIVDVKRFGWARRGYVVFELITGFLIAIVCSIFAGQSALHGSGAHFALPVIYGVLLYEFVRALWVTIGKFYPDESFLSNFERYFLRQVGGTAACGYLAYLIGNLLANHGDPSTQNATTLAAFVVLIALLQIVSATVTSLKKGFHIHQFLELGQVKIGVRMLSAIFGALFWVMVAFLIRAT
ncbi:MAG: hypothetical protein C0519_02440 [Hyphomicrobium sp.]|nr:hypothetical protein [Hyphomicrobium sp.]PPD08877.1 MAG: hypothetical protein CTY28_02065 [Hyphomicrobium sp.]